MLYLTVNGQNHELAMESDTTLLWALRGGFKLTDTSFGCGITIAGGQKQQRNFDDCAPPRLEECPTIVVRIVDSEPGVKLNVPAVANAVYTLSGKPVRGLPIRLRA